MPAKWIFRDGIRGIQHLCGVSKKEAVKRIAADAGVSVHQAEKWSNGNFDSASERSAYADAVENVERDAIIDRVAKYRRGYFDHNQTDER